MRDAPENATLSILGKVNCDGNAERSILYTGLQAYMAQVRPNMRNSLVRDKTENEMRAANSTMHVAGGTYVDRLTVTNVSQTHLAKFDRNKC